MPRRLAVHIVLGAVYLTTAYVLLMMFLAPLENVTNNLSILSQN